MMEECSDEAYQGAKAKIIPAKAANAALYRVVLVRLRYDVRMNFPLKGEGAGFHK
jgi:hypothetical protein